MLAWAGAALYLYAMASPPLIEIIRDGKLFGIFTSEEVAQLRAEGKILPTDKLYSQQHSSPDWELLGTEGMGAREPLSKLDTSEGLRLTVEPEVKPQSNNESNGCCGGCGLFIFLICGFYSVFCFFQRPPLPDAGNMAEAFAYISGAISLLGLFISTAIFSKK
jgi:hypothetical protein